MTAFDRAILKSILRSVEVASRTWSWLMRMIFIASGTVVKWAGAPSSTAFYKYQIMEMKVHTQFLNKHKCFSNMLPHSQIHWHWKCFSQPQSPNCYTMTTLRCPTSLFSHTWKISQTRPYINHISSINCFIYFLI